MMPIPKFNKYGLGLIYRLCCLCLLLMVFACSSNPKNTTRTVGDLDKVERSKDGPAPVFVKPKTPEEIRADYLAYLQRTESKDPARLAALQRLAEMELALNNAQLNATSPEELDVLENNQAYQTRLARTIQLIETSLKDYPDSRNNDQLFYQLAKLYDQQGNYEKSLAYLQRLFDEHQKSPYHIEAAFRLAEDAFSQTDYFAAEALYTEVIVSPFASFYLEKALFKRGWSRFKQQLYLEAVDDQMAAIENHNFAKTEELEKSEQELLSEYLRSISLSFFYVGGTVAVIDYFQSMPDHPYLYPVFAAISDLYLDQERYSDSAENLHQFMAAYPEHEYQPIAQLKIIKIWQAANMYNELYQEIESFYQNYQPDSKYWASYSNPDLRQKVDTALQEYVLMTAGYFHSLYQQKEDIATNFTQANQWYQRYLQHYPEQAKTSNAYYMYAELLAAQGDAVNSLAQYEKAAYEQDGIVNADAAYATVLLTSQLYERQQEKQWLDRHIEYAKRFGTSLPNDPRTEQVLIYAAELAYKTNQPDTAVALTSLLPTNSSTDVRYNAGMIKARTLFDREQFRQAELLYVDILKASDLSREQQQKARDQLALSVYRQAEIQKTEGNTAEAIKNYSRIVEIVPQSEIAATGLYDAIALQISGEQWTAAITTIQLFRQYYPNHKYSNDISKKLSIAYLQSGDNENAAREFAALSRNSDDAELQSAALWQSAELYAAQKNYNQAIQLYTEYVNKNPKPVEKQLEGMYRLIELYTLNGQSSAARNWQEQLIAADKQLNDKEKTDRTRYILSDTYMQLARSEQTQFNSIQLVMPLKVSLTRKKQAMQTALQYYDQAAGYNIADFTTEATFAIGEIYRNFSIALMESERPPNLSEIELEQYVILLEDQAYPFEEKAIDLHEANLGRIKNGIYNDWIAKSYARLQELFPARYDRALKVDLDFEIKTAQVTSNAL